MNNEIASLIQLGDPVEHRGIVVAPLFARRSPRAEYLTLDAALPRGFRVTEVDAQGRVPELVAHNPLASDVLLLDGEELVGAKQDRILNLTVLVAAKSETLLPVSCVEQGRWSARSASFAAASHTAHPQLRRRKNALLHDAPRAVGLAQHAVWDEVAAKAARLGAASPTGAHGDVVASRRPALDRLREQFPLAPRQAGALLALGDELCLDYASRPEAFASLYPKLLDSYLLDGLERLDREPARPEALEAFCSRLGASSITATPSVALGNDLRLSGGGVFGSGLAFEDELLALTAFSGSPRHAQARVLRPATRRERNL